MPAPQARDESGVLVLTLDDPVSLNDGRSDAYREAVYELILNHPEARVAVDLGTIEYLSSSGVAMLIGMKRRLDTRSGRLVLFRVQPYILDVLKVMRLDRFFTITADEPSALAALPA